MLQFSYPEPTILGARLVTARGEGEEGAVDTANWIHPSSNLLVKYFIGKLPLQLQATARG